LRARPVDYPRRMQHSLLRITWILAVAVSTLGCGEAELGEECDEAGKTDECVDGAICTNTAEDAVCRALCVEQEDCKAAGETCNGVAGTNQKSCQPDVK
jgi:hypothetical protein